DLSAPHIDTRTRAIDRDAELRALHDGGEIGRLDLEMLDVALLDLEQDRTRLLQDRSRHAVFLLGRHTDHRIRGNQDALFAAHQQHAYIASGPDGVAGLQ